ncbi:MAG: sigma-54 dependent transcriptional regulator, partial [Planctomycetota bacterium]
MAKIMIVDDEESICWGLSQLCSQLGHDSFSASSAEQAMEFKDPLSIDLVISDVRLPGIDGIEAIGQYKKVFGPIPVITITAFGDLKTAIDAIQRGAFEYIVKPFDLERVKTIIRQALTARKMLELNPQDGVESETDSHEPKLIGSSPVMQEVFKQIALTTTSDAPVLITGESGTGKELTARSIHRFGSRSSKPFVAVNIASLNPLLAESELFGHVKGAFTGADSDRKGLMEQANGGTLFLDEVAEIPLEIQVKLLRVLDLGEVTPVGSNRPIRTRFRLISATNQDLTTQINHGEFRHDLFYRLRTFEIHLPPLRDRKQDLKELVDHFLAHSTPQSSYTDEFLTEVLKRTWK